MKKTTKKLSLGMKIASILACLALVSVGFASWWIVKLPETVTNNEGSFETYAVVDKEIQISTPTYDNSLIVFGKPASGTTRWLSYDASEVKAENLVSTMSFTVSIKDDTTTNLNTFLNKIKIEFDPQDANSAFDTAIRNGSIAAPVVEYKVGNGNWTSAGAYGTDKIAFDIDAPAASTADVQIRFTFDWGTTCGGDNPYTYFNAAGKTYDEYAEIAKALLTDVSKLNGVTYKVSINCTAK